MYICVYIYIYTYSLRRVRRVPPPEVHAAAAGAPALLHLVFIRGYNMI